MTVSVTRSDGEIITCYDSTSFRVTPSGALLVGKPRGSALVNYAAREDSPLDALHAYAPMAWASAHVRRPAGEVRDLQITDQDDCESPNEVQ